MRIGSASIGMESARKYVSSDTLVRKYSIMDYQNNSSYSNALNAAIGRNDEEDGKDQKLDASEAIEEDAKEKGNVYKDWETAFGINRAKLSNVRSSERNSISTLKQLSLRYILEMLFPSKHHKLDDIMKDFQDMNGENSENGGQTMYQVARPLNVTANVMRYTATREHIEREDTSFSAKGSVVTKDGRQIDFNIDVAMSREFVERSSVDLEMVSFSLTDPLIINLDDNIAAADVTDQKFFFDIDADGVKDEISRLGMGSGYLALDKNNDGTINDGSELFGAKTGNGFEELAKYDSDNNGWIDEDDEIWDKLKIWTTDSEGNEVLYSLAQKGVGAICLSNVDTTHSLQNDDGSIKGVIRRSGVFLYENGNVGTLQHVDMASYAKEA